MGRVNRVNSQYLYVRVAEHILDKIESKELQPGAQLDSERSLSAKLGVNRLTVRKGIEMLVNQGVLYRVPSKGTFVAGPKIDQRMDLVLGFSDQLISKGLQPGAEVLEVSVVPATKKISRQLKIDVGTPMYYIQRIRYANSEAVCIEHNYYPTTICPGMDKQDLRQSIYKIFREKYDLSIQYARQTLEAVAPTKDEAELLHISTHTPLMLLVRVGFDSNGHPVEYAKELYRGDRCRFVILGDCPEGEAPPREAFVTMNFER
ncbi:MAG: GntR family transcriptional regulator [Limnochordia bacterium]|jgi:GntR family transcriptional regulator